MADTMDKYCYLWDGSSPDWVLVARESSGHDIFNRRTRMMMLIENDTVQRKVCERMRSAGVEILTQIPCGEFNIEDLKIQDD